MNSCYLGYRERIYEVSLNFSWGARLDGGWGFPIYPLRAMRREGLAQGPYRIAFKTSFSNPSNAHNEISPVNRTEEQNKFFRVTDAPLTPTRRG